MQDNFEEAQKHLGEESSQMQSDNVFQPFPDTCAIKCQEIIIREYGYKTDHNKMIEEAIKMGAFEPDVGTEPQAVGKLFDMYKIPYRQTINGNIYNILYELSQGHKVIVGVNSEELSKHGLYDIEEELNNNPNADHTLIVTGIDFSEPDEVKVVIKDPGTGDIAKSYDAKDFVQAWSNSDFFMVSTTNTPEPELDLPEMEYFNQEIGHLEMIGELPYEQFAEVYEELNEVNFKRVEGWNELCESLADAVNGEGSFDELKYSLSEYIENETDAKSTIKEVLEKYEVNMTDDDYIGQNSDFTNDNITKIDDNVIETHSDDTSDNDNDYNDLFH